MRLARLSDEYGEGVSIEWKAFLLRPTPEPRDPTKFERYTHSWLRPGELEPEATFNTWSGEHPPPSHSLPAAVAAKAAAELGHFEPMHWRLLEAYFSENRTVSDRDVLIDIAGEAGLDRDEFATTIDERFSELAQLVVDEHVEAAESGITGVPAQVVNGGYLIQGAQDQSFYARVITRFQDADPQRGGDLADGEVDRPA